MTTNNLSLGLRASLLFASVTLALWTTPSSSAAREEPTGANLPHGDDYFVLRGGMQNCRLTFEREKRGRVVFLGGSITHMKGWRELVCAGLQRRFPDTEFDFVDAGIPSTGSVPGAFRVLRDVFGRGPVDLLIEEAAVNDASNRPTRPEQWRRGMEGILRHARSVNPQLDIAVLYCVDPGKIADYDAGKTPAVIAAHEQVAAHYGVASVHLAREVADRIRAGQFTWKQDFRNLHPAPFGHRLYAGTIARMFDAAWSKPLAADATLRPHAVPPKPLDRFSYVDARLVPLDRAQCDEGWRLDPSWRPRTTAEKAATRPGFVNVPMLVATDPDATLRFDFHGTAVGLSIIAGPDVGVIRFRIDGGPWRQRDAFTRWSRGLHLPWTLVLADELDDGRHTLTLRTSNDKSEHSRGHACRIAAFCVNGPADESERADVFLLAGQSNMQGLGKIAELDDARRRPVPTCGFWTGGRFETLVPGKTRLSPRPTEFGPELAFARALAETRGSKPFWLVKFQRSGQPLHAGWNNQRWVGTPPGPRRRNFHPGAAADDPHRGVHYIAMLKALETALAALRQEGKQPVVRGIVWMQGEQDSKHAVSAREYAASLRRLKARLEEDLGSGSIPFVFGQVLPYEPAAPRFTHRDLIRQSMAAAHMLSGKPEAIPGVWMVSTDGMPVMPDLVHYTTEGQLALGRAFAAGWRAAVAALQSSGE